MLAWVMPRIGVGAAFAVAAASLILAPLLGRIAGTLDAGAAAELPFSWEHRIAGWAHVRERVAEAPLLGHGFDAVRTFDTTVEMRGHEMSLVSLHPHNAGLHLWVETGVVGVGLAVLALILLARAGLEWAGVDRWRAGALAGLVGAATIVSGVSYGVWQEWWWATVFLAAAMGPLLLDER